MNDISQTTKIYALFSGGKDSTAMTDLLIKQKRCEGVLTIDTTISEPDWLPFINEVCERRKWPLQVLRRKDDKTFDDFVLSYGFPHAGAHWLVMRYLKIRPLEDFIRQHKGEEIIFASGVRRDESHRRSMNVQKISKVGQLKYIAPIHDWTDKQLWNYLKENKLDISPCYKYIHMSGDCRCGAYAGKGEAELESLFYPFTANRIADLETKASKLKLKYNRWGNGSSMLGSIKQSRLEGFMCQGCQGSVAGDGSNERR